MIIILIGVEEESKIMVVIQSIQNVSFMEIKQEIGSEELIMSRILIQV